MLVLSRKIGERLVIGDNVVVTVTQIAGNRVSLGIEAPLEIPVHRDSRRDELEPPKEAAPDPAEIDTPAG